MSLFYGNFLEVFVRALEVLEYATTIKEPKPANSVKSVINELTTTYTCKENPGQAYTFR